MTTSYKIPKKKWHHYLPLCLVILLLIAPHPSFIIIILNYHIRTLHNSFIAFIHVTIVYTLTFLTFSSLLVCVTRDPGSIKGAHHSKPNGERYNAAGSDEELSHLVITDGEEESEMSLAEVLASGRSGRKPKWCKKCMAPKPERAHHCSTCGRCTLKMDHHCPWLASTCIGHRTYPAFIHFIFCSTLQATYVGIVSARAIWYSFDHPFEMDLYTPIHELCLTLAGIVFSLVMGSFFVYHVYLVLTNQTTLENISPFLLLRHLPPLPLRPDEHSMLSDPPKDHELSYKQRRLVKDAHGALRMYDVGWRRNITQVFGWDGVPYGWLWRIWYGGSSPGDGRQFPRNSKTDEVLGRLAHELAQAEITRRS